MDVDEEDVIIEISPNEYQTLIYVTKSTQRVISVGKDALKKSIQNDTQTTIKCSKIQKDGTTKRVVGIKGATHKDVYTARQKIKAIGGNDNGQNQPTHFTCIKITDPTIKANYLKFKDENLTSEKTTETHKGAFMRPEKLHITFGVMCLPDDESHLRAQQILVDCLEKIVKPIKCEYGKIEFKVNGLELMKGSPEEARVLYAKIESDSLQKIADAITNSYIHAGLGKKEGSQNVVKLHMTLMNIKYAKRRNKKANSFDATHIFEQHTDFEFGCQEVSQILLVDMKRMDEEGFYKCVTSVDL